jgi:hypothetical protein
MISAKVDTGQVVLRFSRMPQNVLQALVPALDIAGYNLVTHIVRDELSGQILNRRSGTLSNAVTHTTPTISGNTVSTKVGVFSGVPYARPLEYGAYIPPVSGPLMVFSAKDGTTVFTRKRKGFQLKEYAYMRRGLADQRADIIAQISKAVQQA